MDTNETVQNIVFTFSPDNVIAIIGIIAPIIVALIGGVYAITTNTKKYELSEDYKREILQWYDEVVADMIWIIHYIKNKRRQTYIIDSVEFFERAVRLSSLAEKGRFYFPNILTKDGYGNKKESAYQGLKNICLEFIIAFYNEAFYNTNPSISNLQRLERLFTSCIFDMIEPRKRNKKYAKNLDDILPVEKSINDFVKENYDKIDLFIHSD